MAIFQVGLGNIGLDTVNLSGIFNITYIVSAGLLVIVLAAVVFLVLRYILKHDVRCILLDKTGDGIMMMKDRGWVNTDNIEFKLLKKRKIKCTYPTSDKFIQEGKKKMLIGMVVDNVCVWLKPETSGLVAPNMNLMNFQVDTYAKIDEATKLKLKFWDKYGHQILWMSSMVIFLIVIILILNKMDKILDLGSALAGKIGEGISSCTVQSV